MPGPVKNKNWIILYLIGALLSVQSFAQTEMELPVYLSEDRMLKYYPDEFGNRIPDYSYCGYKAGEVTIPSVPVKVIVPLKEGDATEYIQNAIDYVSSLPLNEKRFRGTILLEKGIYTLNGRLKIMASGIVLRGSGTGDKGTTIIQVLHGKHSSGFQVKTTGNLSRNYEFWIPMFL
ncbi:hypothetical protein ES708_23906 [subsurface metagenome]